MYELVLSVAAVGSFIAWYRRYSERAARRSYAAYYRWMKGGRP